ncbi:MAG: helix-turn-helix domain-containing protein [Clostridia bacterium]|nr:helix-turn-helix domain-containing protein [Clostridia bacterium]
MDFSQLGNRIREERQRLGLTQEKFAEEIGVSDSYIGQIERGERSLSLETLVKLANRLGVTVDYLLLDLVKVKDEELLSELLQILDKRTHQEKRMALDVIKVMFKHLDEGM